MDSTEFDDFIRALKGNGYSANDFILNNIDHTNWNPQTIAALRGQVTVKRKSTNKEKTYNTGFNTHWVIDFEDDLKAKSFD